jgi:hypothetical protein
MSNQVVIQRHEVKNLDTGETWKEAFIFDSYGDLGSVPMDKLPEDNLALFSKLIRGQLKNDYVGINDIIGYLHNNRSGVTIAGKYYDYWDIEEALGQYIRS